MAEISKPAETVHWIARNADGSVLHQGTTSPDQVTTTGQPVLDPSDSGNEQLQKLAAYASKFPELPPEGTQVELGEIYSLAGVLYRVRQSHTRTSHDPQDIPALWLWYRPDESIDWVAGEQVYIGTIRTSNAIKYKCIQAHVTQDGWEPANVPALWQVVAVPTTDWAPGQVVAVGDIRMYNGTQYRCRQAHTTQAGWEPPNVPALWEVAQ